MEVFFMKAKWKTPQVKKLNLEETKAVEAIIMYRSGSPELVTMDLEPFIGWKCPCCQKESGYIFNQEGEAQNDFKTNHLPNCLKYDKVHDRCMS